MERITLMAAKGKTLEEEKRADARLSQRAKQGAGPATKGKAAAA
jgi:hypothetical protein